MHAQQLPATLGVTPGSGGSFVSPHPIADISQACAFLRKEGKEEGPTRPLPSHLSISPPTQPGAADLPEKPHSPQAFSSGNHFGCTPDPSSPLRVITQSITQSSFPSLLVLMLSHHALTLRQWTKGLLSKPWGGDRGIPRKKPLHYHMCIT